MSKRTEQMNAMGTVLRWGLARLTPEILGFLRVLPSHEVV
jgi:hypothetical protein